MGFSSEGNSYSAAPFIVYRSEKYSGIKQRAFHYLATYGRSYLLHPIINCIRTEVRNLFYDILSAAFLIIISPVLFIAFIGLLSLRRFRVLLIKRFHPKCDICENVGQRWFVENEGQGMVTSVVWVKGQLDGQTLSSQLEFQISSQHRKLSILRKTLSVHYGIPVWEESSVPFSIQNHVLQAPAKFYNTLITDETREMQGFFGGNSDKSVLQKYVTSRASVQGDDKLPPWQITVIPLPPSGSSVFGVNRNKTCVVIRFHRLLLQQPEVVEMFRNGLGQPGQLDIIEGGEGSHEWISVVHPEVHSKDSPDYTPPISLEKQLYMWIDKNYKSILSNMEVWLHLRKKQYEFHSKLALLKCILQEIQHEIKRSLDAQKLKLDSIRDFAFRIIQNLRGVIYIPFFVLDCFLYTTSNNGNGKSGFQKNEKPSTRHVSWSKPISTQLLRDICKKTENSSEESVLLVACSLALRDYYSENCILNPQNVGVSISSTCTSNNKPSFSHPTKTIDLFTGLSDVSATIKRLNSDLITYPKWKQFGFSFLQQFSSHFLPGSLAYFLYKRMFQRYPISFNFIDTESAFPHLTLWGQTVDEFTFWKAPQSDFCVSITVVKYAGTLRLSLISPMKCVDSAITQRYCQYLNKVAESVGVPKGRIPYSRKSSPNSSSASSPNQKRFPSEFPTTSSKSKGLQKYNSSQCLSIDSSF